MGGLQLVVQILVIDHQVFIGFLTGFLDIGHGLLIIQLGLHGLLLLIQILKCIDLLQHAVSQACRSPVLHVFQNLILDHISLRQGRSLHSFCRKGSSLQGQIKELSRLGPIPAALYGSLDISQKLVHILSVRTAHALSQSGLEVGL